MKIRLRAHETMFVTLLGVLLLIRYFLPMIVGSVQDFEMDNKIGFVNAHFPFNLFRNVLLPDIGLGLLIYLAYLCINRWVIPRLTARMSIKRLLVAAGQLILIAVLLIVSHWTYAYFRNEYMFQYPGFTIFPKYGFNPNPQIDIHGGMKAVGICLFWYMIWVSFREALIGLIGRKGERRDYRIMIANQVTGFLAVYALFPIVNICWSPPIGGIWFAFYAALFPSACLVFINLYWLFPVKGQRSFLQKKVLAGLLLSSFICAGPVLLFSLFAFLLSWIFQLVVVIPFSWLLYRRHAARILKLRGLEKALVRSNADLQFLRSQINPHFLFNALNTLYGTALVEGAEHTGAGIQKLGDMMRFMLHENNQDFILMNREIEYLENYISMQRLRISNSSLITIEAQIDKEIYPHRIAPMLFIPFVENAFKHGISLKERSWIKIRFSGDQRNIRFEVRNSIHRLAANDPEKESSGIGLKNVIARLELLYPGRFQISTAEEGNEFAVLLIIQP